MGKQKMDLALIFLSNIFLFPLVAAEPRCDLRVLGVSKGPCLSLGLRRNERSEAALGEISGSSSLMQIADERESSPFASTTNQIVRVPDSMMFRNLNNTPVAKQLFEEIPHAAEIDAASFNRVGNAPRVRRRGIVFRRTTRGALPTRLNESVLTARRRNAG